MRIEEFFNRNYESEERYWWKADNRYDTDPDRHPASLMTRSVLREIRFRAPGAALDLGGGEGSDSIRLARMGWSVDLVDASTAGVRKATEFAGKANAPISAYAQAVENFEPTRTYDLIISNGMLHYVKNKRPVLEMMQRITNPQGLNAISLWSTFSPMPTEHRIVECFPDDEDGVVTRAYRAWDKPLLYFERIKQEGGHLEFAPHVHSFIKLVAIKPGDHSSKFLR